MTTELERVVHESHGDDDWIDNGQDEVERTIDGFKWMIHPWNNGGGWYATVITSTGEDHLDQTAIEGPNGDDPKEAHDKLIAGIKALAAAAEGL